MSQINKSNLLVYLTLHRLVQIEAFLDFDHIFELEKTRNQFETKIFIPYNVSRFYPVIVYRLDKYFHVH